MIQIGGGAIIVLLLLVLSGGDVMQVKALKTFSGLIAMKTGDVREITDKAIYTDLIKAGYVEEVKEVKPSRKKVSADEN